MAMFELRNERHDQIPQIRQDLLRVMRSETAKDFDCFDFYVVIRVFHAVKEHQQVLVARDERIKVRIQAQEHGTPNIDITICGGCHEELVH